MDQIFMRVVKNKKAGLMPAFLLNQIVFQPFKIIQVVALWGDFPFCFELKKVPSSQIACL